MQHTFAPYGRAEIPPAASDGVRLMHLFAYRGTSVLPDLYIGLGNQPLKQPLRLWLKELDTGWMFSDTGLDAAFLAREAAQADKAAIRLLTISGSGRVVNGSFVSASAVRATHERPGSGSADPQARIARLRSPQAHARIRQQLKQHGISIINDCLHIPPYTHLVLTDNRRLRYELAFRSNADATRGRVLQLVRIDRLTTPLD
ncbi:MAG: hypothetical protein Q4E06_02705 [Lautropia sp.]|nr:hypothetical protein [Lautropia sp.]